jgi:hypothetical protein
VDTEKLNVQAIWVQSAQPPSAAAGMHRYALGGAAGRGFGFGGFGRGAEPPAAPDACTAPAGAAGAKAGGGRGVAPSLSPGDYTVRLTVGGQTYSQPVTIKPDPRGLPNGVKDGSKIMEEPSDDDDG